MTSGRASPPGRVVICTSRSFCNTTGLGLMLFNLFAPKRSFACIGSCSFPVCTLSLVMNVACIWLECAQTRWIPFQADEAGPFAFPLLLALADNILLFLFQDDVDQGC